MNNIGQPAPQKELFKYKLQRNGKMENSRDGMKNMINKAIRLRKARQKLVINNK